MLFKTSVKNICFAAAALLLSGCEYFQNRTAKEFMTDPFASSEYDYAKEAASMRPADLRRAGAVVVCRSHQCAPAKLSMSREYVYNSLLHLFDNNNYQKALICQADAASHTCLENYVTLPIKAGITPTNAYIDSVRLTDVIIGKRADKINLVLNYNLTYGGQTPDCTPSKSILFAKNVNHVLLEDSGYTCKMTSIGQTTVKTVFAIDYIDLDYGYIGGFYSIGLSGPAYGGGSGYMMLRLPKNAYPLSPELRAATETRQQKKNKRTSSAAATAAGISEEVLSRRSDVTNSKVQVFPIQPTEAASEPAEKTMTVKEGSTLSENLSE